MREGEERKTEREVGRKRERERSLSMSPAEQLTKHKARGVLINEATSYDRELTHCCPLLTVSGYGTP